MSAGVFHDWEQIRYFLTDYRIFEPNSEAVEIYNRSYEIYRNIYKQLKPSFEAVQKLYL